MIRVGRSPLRPAGRLAGPVSLYPPVLRRRVSQPRVQSMSEQLLYFLQQMFNGLTLGSTYALIAIGYTMVYGIIGMINFAHGEVYM
ncbi:ABC transporter permease subunit, partial [Serratia marcescens]|uniref:ABC transporter permease subunit n=2 Tax=Serratia marcescens TaxID=615 RepID=UPI0039C9AC05